ncbi:AMP-binding protein [Hyphococcus flavus]|uniref:AMP-binding protein n=1 Tax=Hyphococcus flavus TaxID=1866326 RepID=A0AAE9ZDD2_9PROT|nr:AMP-binding protein [Hyphococcus flavus]WDI31520.1 AMP-binding protein [Hyphococcus flavus]
MSNANFFETLKAAYSNAFDKPCLSLPNGRSFTYGDIDALSAKMAGALLATGAKPGDRITVQVEKSAENIALYLGAMRAGLIYVPLNTAYTPEEVQYFLSDAKPAIFVCSPENYAALAPAAKKARLKKLFTLGAEGNGSLPDTASSISPFKRCCSRTETDTAVILYTSGTTGRSKGAMLTHGNLRSNAETLNTLWDFTHHDVLLHALPVFHIHGLFVALHTAMLSACEILFLPKFDVCEILSQLPKSSVMMGVPTFYTRLLANVNFTKTVCESVRLFISGSAPLTTETFKAFETRTGHKILERYGMSEAGMIASNPLNGERVAGTVGYPLPKVSIRISGEAPSEVEIKGPNVFAGYWEKPDKTKEVFTKDLWFRTGDIGTLSDDGRLTLVGREKDLIISGGFNIYPVEIEQVINALSGVAESAVIGVPHPDMGEGVVAILVEENSGVTDEALSQAVSKLAKFKRPRRFIRLRTLPRNAMGKVQKQALRETYKNIYRV